MYALKKGLEYYVSKGLLLVIMETDSLILKKILDGIWEVPQKIAIDIKRIEELVMQFQVQVVHTRREGNKMTNFFANEVFCFVGYQNKEYTSLQDVTREGKAILELDKQ